VTGWLAKDNGLNLRYLVLSSSYKNTLEGRKPKFLGPPFTHCAVMACRAASMKDLGSCTACLRSAWVAPGNWCAARRLPIGRTPSVGSGKWGYREAWNPHTTSHALNEARTFPHVRAAMTDSMVGGAVLARDRPPALSPSGASSARSPTSRHPKNGQIVVSPTQSLLGPEDT
jgi:hypothetical protein